MEELISRVFQARDFAHIEHLTTSSDAAHRALGEFYDGIIGAVDAIAEAHQGVFGRISAEDIEVLPRPAEPMAEYLEAELTYIVASREEIAMKDPVLLNLVDTLGAVYSKCLYRLKFL